MQQGLSSLHLMFGSPLQELRVLVPIMQGSGKYRQQTRICITTKSKLREPEQSWRIFTIDCLWRAYTVSESKYQRLQERTKWLVIPESSIAARSGSFLVQSCLETTGSHRNIREGLSPRKLPENPTNPVFTFSVLPLDPLFEQQSLKHSFVIAFRLKRSRFGRIDSLVEVRFSLVLPCL